MSKELTDEQRAAAEKFVGDLKKAMPAYKAMGDAAREVHQALLTAPVWHLADAPKGFDHNDANAPQEWSVGHAQVNYVDHIDTKEDDIP